MKQTGNRNWRMLFSLIWVTGWCLQSVLGEIQVRGKHRLEDFSPFLSFLCFFSDHCLDTFQSPAAPAGQGCHRLANSVPNAASWSSSRKCCCWLVSYRISPATPALHIESAGLGCQPLLCTGIGCPPLAGPAWYSKAIKGKQLPIKRNDWLALPGNMDSTD